MGMAINSEMLRQGNRVAFVARKLLWMKKQQKKLKNAFLVVKIFLFNVRRSLRACDLLDFLSFYKFCFEACYAFLFPY